MMKPTTNNITLTASEIYIKNLRFHAYHGVLPQENIVGNDFVINIRLHYGIEKAMQTDELSSTISYATVFDIIKKEMQITSKLLEHVAGRIVKQLFIAFPTIEEIHLDLRKLNPPMSANCDGAGIVLHMRNELL